MFGPNPLALVGGFAPGLGLDAVKPGEVAQGAGGNGALVGLRQIEEFAPRVGHAAELDDGAVAEPGLVAGVVVDAEVSGPAAQEGAGMLAFAAGLVVEQEDRRLAVEPVADTNLSVNMTDGGVGCLPSNLTRNPRWLGCFRPSSASPMKTTGKSVTKG